MSRATPILLIAIATACGGDPPASPAPAYVDPREPCADRDPLRRAFFGDLHVHTALSFDAWTYDVRATPADAYRFARGETIHLPPLDASGAPTVPVRLKRPLDFAAVTDHSEYLGETSLCTTPGSPAYHSPTCQNYRPPLSSLIELGVGTDPPVRSPICGEGAAACLEAAAPVWNRITEAAESAYDRSSACSFTTFIGYEYTLSPLATNLHRNVIFRNARALPAPITLYDAPRPLDLWTRLRAECNSAGTGCEAIAIPHNSNVSNGRMFRVEYPGAGGADDERRQAALRAQMEPLVEIFQHKGDSECINGLPSNPGAPDEFCDFEKAQLPPMDDCGPDGKGTGGLAGLGCTSWRDFVRGALLNGLLEEARIGINPYKLGILASTDTHNGTPGAVDEGSFRGHLGRADNTPETLLGGDNFSGSALLVNPGGLAGVWAEENSRDAIFDALKRREVFGTSGPRITVRLFAGWKYPDNLCANPKMVEEGYSGGVPMGGDLPPRRPEIEAGGPKIVVAAMRDPGTPDAPGAKLQRLQVVKLWIDASGAPREQVVDIGGDPKNGATVDPVTCAPAGPGADSLCAVWTDPAFDPARSAVYYARVIENPTCRFTTVICNSLAPEERMKLHCDDGTFPKTIQERAWSSPVWYGP
ncbi:MAG TPA: DUF3604 domain-containing protein [Polyangiaceae bacterium]|nr:DUF3604 domain-containing protein [Polyangiaceae bacterium]